MPVGLYPLMSMCKIYCNCLIVVFIIISQMLQLTIFYNRFIYYTKNL